MPGPINSYGIKKFVHIEAELQAEPKMRLQKISEANIELIFLKVRKQINF